MDVFSSPSRQRREAEIGKVFDRWARDGKASGMERRHRRLAELMLRRIDLPRDARVLDVGCGDGWTVRLLADRLSEGAFVGIDLSPEMVRLARRSCASLENVLFAPAAAEEIPWAEDYFTHILSIESAYYWPEPALAARELYRVAAHGGSLHILINYYAENPYSAGWEDAMGLALHRFSATQWERLLNTAGFEGGASERIPDDSPISPGKPPAELERRQGLQRIGALYLQGRKPALPAGAARPAGHQGSPFRILS